MDKDKTLFTVREFADLHGINRRTLHYYDNIGLFSPAVKKENHYRMYSIRQSTELEIILALRELSMSVEDIRAFLRNRSSASCLAFIREKKEETDASIRTLESIRQLLLEKEEFLQTEQSGDTDEITLVTCPEETLLVSPSLHLVPEEESFIALMRRAGRNHSHRLFNHGLGSMLPVSCILSGDFDSYSCFFMKMPVSSEENVPIPAEDDCRLHRKPASAYLRAYCRGDWSRLPGTYRRILAFARENGLTLTGYAYEQGMNDLSVCRMEDYLTRILIPCRRTQEAAERRHTGKA